MVKVQHYHVNSGAFADNLVKQAVLEESQTLSFFESMYTGKMELLNEGSMNCKTWQIPCYWMQHQSVQASAQTAFGVSPFKCQMQSSQNHKSSRRLMMKRQERHHWSSSRRFRLLLIINLVRIHQCSLHTWQCPSRRQKDIQAEWMHPIWYLCYKNLSHERTVALVLNKDCWCSIKTQVLYLHNFTSSWTLLFKQWMSTVCIYHVLCVAVIAPFIRHNSRERG